ncbi:DUF1573 domain-containing protein [Capnocytophaga sp. oral taxon 878]|uniref:DUF1573 domain-containing protein n=1 Tax=Capnocytophaga sp. oral taxon 878 TaxID=1316596 RepID=UPI000D03BEA1|nr:DUF1573 domain-containing protein [Capnocytophaga sp. oral taxon 878]AVM49020.1 hypothetical protein C4H12_00240 [Capnocytophaga sp. oral taxon 878]
MKKFLTFVFLAFFGVMAYAQDAQITFKAEEIDYGTIKQGADGVRIFEFTNTGKAPLVIANAYSSCGCTVPTWTNQPIAPGAKGKIEVRYDTNRVGPISKTITVQSNAKDAPTKTLRIRGTIVQ